MSRSAGTRRGFCRNIGLKVVTGIRLVYVAAMIVRARHLFVTWLFYGVVQLGLLGVPYVSGQVSVGSREVCAQSSAQSISATKRFLASERTERAAHTPFAPSATVVLGLANVAGPSQIVGSPDRVRTFELIALQPARAPPVLV
jgi:hypothetical protein